MENVVPTLSLIAGTLSPICVLVVGYLTYRVAQNKNAFDKSKAILELEHTELQIECKRCQDKVNLLEKDIETLRIRIESFSINETKLLKELQIAEDSREEFKDKYLSLMERGK